MSDKPEHCWHPMAVANMAGTIEVRCCWCGVEARQRYTEVDEAIDGHGPHELQRRRIYGRIVLKDIEWIPGTNMSRDIEPPECSR